MACVVVDSLTSRGWDVCLISGPDARKALRRSTRLPSAGLRVVILPHPIQADALVQMRRVLDPLGFGDLLVSSLDTPHDLIEQIVRFHGPKPRRRRVATTRAYFERPTLLESEVARGGALSLGLGSFAGAAAVVAALYVSAHPEAVAVARLSPDADAGAMLAPTAITMPVTTSAPSSSPLVDDEVFAAAIPSGDTFPGDDLSRIPEPRPKKTAEPMRPRRPRAHDRAALPEPDVEEVLIIEDDEDLTVVTVSAPLGEDVVVLEDMPAEDPSLELDELAQIVVDAQELAQIADGGETTAPLAVTFDPFVASDEAVPQFH
jgi:hypothetical protein